MHRTFVLRAGVLLAACAAVVVAFAAPAAAHVTVNPNTATQGGFAKLAFRVPDEKDTAATVKVEVNLPTDTPIASVSIKPLTGWTATVTKSKLATPITSDDGQVTEAVSRITWVAAAGGGIQPGQFQEFEVSVGPLPKTGKLVFKALQTYSDGDVVRWIDEPAADGTEPEHPAPTLTLVAANADNAAPAAAAGNSGSDNGSGGAGLIALVALLLGAAGLVVGLMALRRTARPTS